MKRYNYFNSILLIFLTEFVIWMYKQVKC